MGTDLSDGRAWSNNRLLRRHVRDHDLCQQNVLDHQEHHPRRAGPLAFERGKALADDHAIGRVGAHPGAFNVHAVQLLLLLEESEGELEDHGSAVCHPYCGLDHCLGDLPL